MSEAELLGRVAAYLLSCWALGLGSWALAGRALPPAARLGTRLLAVLAGQLVLTAMLVQALGLLGLLSAPCYFAACLAIGAAALWRRRGGRPRGSLSRRVGSGFRLLCAAPSWGLGWLAAALLLLLAGRLLALPQDIDALSLHGPLVVEWVQQGRIPLASHWGYPQCWEYQLAPLFLLLRGDLLAVVPALSAAAALFLAVRELAARLRLPAGAGYLVALLGTTVAVVWRDPFKNDVAFAVAVLLGALAIERAARARGGAFWLIQLAVFLMLGTKPSGFLYAAAFGTAYGLAAWWRRRRGPLPPAPLSADGEGGSEKGAGPHTAPATRTGHPETPNVIPAKAGIQSSPSAAALFPGLVGKGQGPSARSLIFGLAITLVLQVSAAAVQLRNLVVHGNPIYPVRFRLAGVEPFPGTAEVAGTSILEHLGQLETWRQFLNGGRAGIGVEWPFLLALLAVAAWLSLAGLRKRGPRAISFEMALPWAALALWALFTATPWSCGLGPGSWDYLANGSSLRYAIAPICLSYLAAATVLRRWLGARGSTVVLAVAGPALIFWKWHTLAQWSGAGLVAGAALAALALLALAGPLLALRSPRWRRPAAVGLASSLLAVSFGFARRVELSREATWMPAYREVWTEVWREVPPGSAIAYNLPRPLFRYLLFGSSFENRLVQVDIGKGRRGEIPAEAARFYLVPPAGGAPLEQMLAAMAARGWRVAARTDETAPGAGVLLERAP